MATSRKPEFSIRNFNKLMNSFSSKFSGNGSDQLKESWKEVVRNEFDLSDDQDKSVLTVSRIIDKEVQKDFNQIAEHLKAGGQVNGMIILNDDRSHTINIFLGHANASGESLYRSIPVASCDANCRNWRWGRRRRRR